MAQKRGDGPHGGVLDVGGLVGGEAGRADERASEVRALDVLAVLREKPGVLEFAEPVADSPGRVVNAIGVLVRLLPFDVGDVSHQAPWQEDASHASSCQRPRSAANAAQRASTVRLRRRKTVIEPLGSRFRW